MIDGNHIIELGYPKGPVIGLALEVARSYAKNNSDKAILQELGRVLDDPGAVRQDSKSWPVAQALVKEQQRKEAYMAHQPRDPAPYKAWGEDMVDDQTRKQMETALTLPVALKGALMPDGHLGYGLPIGGILATDNSVVPYAVGVDIACRMMMTVTNGRIGGQADKLIRAIELETRFGAGASFKKNDKRQHAILDDPRWGDIPFLRSLKNTGYSQLGSSGGGNHFVEWGEFTTNEPLQTPYGKLAPGTYLALLSHSGSRGTGFKIANHYTRVAKDKCKGLPKELEHLAWLSLDDPDGQEYWAAMEFAGDYASACHHTIHENVLRAAGVKPLLQVENHHNFAWKEQIWVDGAQREAIVHRKGATPAWPGQLGLIPGTMADTSYLVRGRDWHTDQRYMAQRDALHSSSHGAGRKMSRTEAINTVPRKPTRELLKERGVTLLGASFDEAPDAYKDIDEVIDAQSDLIERVGSFTPRIVKMAGDKAPI